MSIRALLQGWTRDVGPAGATFTHAEGPARGQIRVLDRQPLRPFDAWITDAAGDGAGTRAAERKQLETAEGELATLASVTVEAEGKKVEHTVGVVFGDDWCFVVHAATAVAGAFAELRALARKITQTTFLGLGERRRRRYLHVAPPGWAEERVARATHYRPPGHPAVRGLVIVDDTLPRGLSAEEEADRTYVLGGYEPRESDEPATAVKVAGFALPGLVRWYRVTSRSGVVIGARAELSDDRFLYRQHLFGRAEAEPVLVQAFLDLVFSVKPLPRPWARRAVGSSFYTD
jgi:hypothetical protein